MDKHHKPRFRDIYMLQSEEQCSSIYVMSLDPSLKMTRLLLEHCSRGTGSYVQHYYLDKNEIRSSYTRANRRDLTNRLQYVEVIYGVVGGSSVGSLAVRTVIAFEAVQYKRKSRTGLAVLSDPVNESRRAPIGTRLFQKWCSPARWSRLKAIVNRPDQSPRIETVDIECRVTVVQQEEEAEAGGHKMRGTFPRRGVCATIAPLMHQIPKIPKSIREGYDFHMSESLTTMTPYCMSSWALAYICPSQPISIAQRRKRRRRGAGLLPNGRHQWADTIDAIPCDCHTSMVSDSEVFQAVNGHQKQVGKRGGFVLSQRSDREREAADGKGLVQGPEAESSRNQEDDSNLESRQHNQRFAPQKVAGGPDCQRSNMTVTSQRSRLFVGQLLSAGRPFAFSHSSSFDIPRYSFAASIRQQTLGRQRLLSAKLKLHSIASDLVSSCSEDVHIHPSPLFFLLLPLFFFTTQKNSPTYQLETHLHNHKSIGSEIEPMGSAAFNSQYSYLREMQQSTSKQADVMASNMTKGKAPATSVYPSPADEVNHTFPLASSPVFDDQHVASSVRREKITLPPISSLVQQMPSPSTSPQLPLAHYRSPTDTLLTSPNKFNRSQDAPLFPDQPTTTDDIARPQFLFGSASNTILMESLRHSHILAAFLDLFQLSLLSKSNPSSVLCRTVAVLNMVLLSDHHMDLELRDMEGMIFGLGKLPILTDMSHRFLTNATPPGVLADLERISPADAAMFIRNHHHHDKRKVDSGVEMPPPKRTRKTSASKAPQKASVSPREAPLDVADKKFRRRTNDANKARTPADKVARNFLIYPDYCPPTSTLDSDQVNFPNIEWKATPQDVTDHEDCHLLHAKEIPIVSKLVLTPSDYIYIKRRFFAHRLAYARKGQSFNINAAQLACKGADEYGITGIDVNKTSRLHKAFDKVGWLDEKHMQKYL
ncbi:hypothetical protein KCU65_g223, partial [Aureobasidium melanogenum]